MRKEVKGSAVVEMSYIMPLFLLLFLMIVHTTFYFHDKAVITGAAGETAAVGAQMERKKRTEEYSLEDFFGERVRNKLVYMSIEEISISKSEEKIKVDARASRSFMGISVSQSAVIVRPEEQIRLLSFF